MNYGKLTAGTTKTAIDTAKPSEKGEIITYLSRMGDVLHNCPERRDVVGCGLHAGVDAVQKRDVPHPLFREVPLHVVAGHDVVSAQTGQVFGDNHVDLLGLNIADHSLKIRTVKVGSAPAIVNVGVIELQTMFLHEFI